MTAYIIQTASNTATVGSTVTVTLTGQTRAGNCIIVIAADEYATTQATVSGITLGGSADNFTQMQSTGSTANTSYTTIWADPSCAGGQTSVVVTFTGGVGALSRLNAIAMEVGGLNPVSAQIFDGYGTNGTNATSASWNTGTTPFTSDQAELWVGAVSAVNPTSVTPPGWPFINLTAVGSASGLFTQVGYQPIPNTGTGTYNGTFGSAASYWGLIVSFKGLGVAAPNPPNFAAGAGVQQGDLNNLVTSPLGFYQQRAIFRAAQVNTTTALPAGAGSGVPGLPTTIAYDTVYEDPYQGWSTVNHTWTAPYTGWYHCMAVIETGAGPSDLLLVLTFLATSFSGNITIGTAIMPTTGGNIQGMDYIFMVGGQDTIQVQAYVYGTTGVSTANTVSANQFQIEWVAAS